MSRHFIDEMSIYVLLQALMIQRTLLLRAMHNLQFGNLHPSQQGVSQHGSHVVSTKTVSNVFLENVGHYSDFTSVRLALANLYFSRALALT